ncbi:hypothetical protein C1645_733658 [Glomus cerebriforme]|uniref:Actin-like ATPase domain-containing protein n=1 Tax=Glomus cerebriforme TaxID=658196 RepID=A0A397TEX3_9GLOM|nr:hypothetical protein C1645_733658 [Glomus cerebriforme]
MNLLEKFEKLNNRLTNLLEENKGLKQQYENLQQENQELKEKLDERNYKNLQEENNKLKENLDEKDRQFLNLEKQKNKQLEIISQNLEEFKRKYKNLQEENKKLNEGDKQFRQHILNLERQHKNLKEENKKLNERERQFRQRILNLEKQKSEELELKRQNKNLQEEIKRLNEKDKQSQQRILNLEKQKSEELEIISQNLEKALGKLGLDELDEKNESLNDDYYKDKDYIHYLGPEKSEESSKDESNQTQRTERRGYSHSENEISFNENFRVVVGLDFGATYSGFSYCHVSIPKEICTNDQWPGELGNLKTNTVLQYDYEYNNVESWGFPALSKRPSRRMRIKDNKPVELFKLYLGNLSSNLLPSLPVDYKKTITDYLREIGKLIKETIATRYSIDSFDNVLLVLTVPAEWSSNSVYIMRECVHKAELIGERDSKNLQFTTEPEAVAIYCMDKLREFDLTIGSTFMVVDCGGGTVDLTTRKLLDNNMLSEITERAGDFCGSTFIDREFINFLRRILGSRAINLFRENNYGQLQYMVHKFCQRGKLPFTGDDTEFCYELDIKDTAPILLQYISEDVKEKIEENDWIIEIRFDDIKQMFDPIVNRILHLIRAQLENTRETCSTIFLAGGFSESKYLQRRIKQEFQHIVPNIYVPSQPTAATSRGAALYGLSLKNSVRNNSANNIMTYVISSRILKYTYGIQQITYWMEGDPIERKTPDGYIFKFHCLVRRGTKVEVNQKFKCIFTPLSPVQKRASFKIYYTREYDAKYCDEPNMEYLGILAVLLPDPTLDKLLFAFTFENMGINASVMNQENGKFYMTTFELDDY